MLLSSVADKNLEQFDTTEAIQCTEIYEFVQKLGKKEFEMPFLQVQWILAITFPANCSVLALQVSALCEACGGWAVNPGPGLCQGAG